MGLSRRCKRGGNWRGRSGQDYESCYKDNDENEANSVFVIRKSKVYFATQFGYCPIARQSYLVLGPEVTEDTLALAVENGCL